MFKKKVILFLKGERGLNCLKIIINKKSFEILLVVTKVNNKKLIKKINKNYKIKTLHSQNVNNKKELKLFNSLKPDFFLICGYPDIFKSKILSIPKNCTLNLHAGRLPKYRGGSPLNWQIINGEKKVSASVIKVNEDIDGGYLVVSKSVGIKINENIESVQKKINKIFPKLLLVSIDKILKKKKLKKINIKKSIYWHQRDDRDGRIRFQFMNSRAIHNLVRACSHPYRGAWAKINKNYKIRFFKSEIIKEKILGNAGKLIFLKKKGMCLVCRDRALRILEYETNYKKKLNGIILN